MTIPKKTRPLTMAQMASWVVGIDPSGPKKWQQKTQGTSPTNIRFKVVLGKQYGAVPKPRTLGWLFFCPRDPGSPKLRMVSWNLNTLRFGGDCTPLAHHLTR